MHRLLCSELNSCDYVPEYFCVVELTVSIFIAVGDLSRYTENMVNCGVCVKAVGSRLKLKCCDCVSEFHASCVKMTKADVDFITADELPWRCSNCEETRRRSMRFELDANEGKLSLEDIMDKVKEILEKQTSQEASFNKAHEPLNEKINENTSALVKQNENLEKCLNLIDELAQENKMLKKRLAEMERRLEDTEQYSRINSVEIHGIPMEKNEDVVSVVQKVGKALSMDISEQQIDTCHRLGNRNGPNGSPPGIIVKFVRRLDKEAFLQKRRVKRDLSTRHMNLTMDRPVYVNEALSPMRRRLFAEARRFKKDNNIRFLWVRGGKIFLRADENEPVVQVTCQDDFLNVKLPPQK